MDKQGKVEAAKAQLSEIQRLTREAERSFAHVNLQASLMVKKELVAGEEFELRLDLVNVARSSGSVVRIEGMVHAEFQVQALPAFCTLQGSSLITTEKIIGSFQVVTIKVKLKATEGIYRLAPKITYIDDLGENKTCQVEPSTINVRSAEPAYEVLPNRMTTGYSALDHLLFGGIPQDNAVILSSPSSNERELLARKFLEAGLHAQETTFFVTAEPGTTKAFVKRYPSGFHLLSLQFPSRQHHTEHAQRIQAERCRKPYRYRYCTNQNVSYSENPSHWSEATVYQ